MDVRKCICLLFSLVTVNAFASNAIEVSWDNLRPNVAPNPITLPELSGEHLRKIQTVFTLMHSSNPEDVTQLEQAVQQLQEDNIDAMELLKMREAYIQAQKIASESLTTEFDGKKVRIPGFMVPIQFSDAMVATEFLLVPVAGACIHMPPPPANQIVRVSFPKGYAMRTVQYPVWVEGTLQSSLTHEEVYIVDGTSNVSMGYQMQASMVVDYH
ncbi:DUF3299 domain-containing protein [Vibrio ezurae]|uniref:DUF3299 domain-containing protein n=1 Tax=Vibrio ezurae NBRC 102218 TaxID=1219080 RepID=U3AIN8_9VIBR|nr:DUF3299 domain-containing protein [Vibrio ezurae]GAD79771.1 hypothetical protein VEZ01S_20_00430 [Vibrio ezurae NBRC 102218]